MQSILQNTTGIGPKPVQPDNLNGRVAVVVGGAFGIGFEISRALANAGCQVIMVNRKEEQGTDARETIKSESPDASVEWRECDMGHLAQVRDVFSQLRESLDRLDFLVLCAGINTNEFGLDADGIDRHFGVNFLGQFYVVNQLWPVLRKTSKMPGTPAPRVVFESSEMHRTAPNNVHFASLEEINDSSIGPTELYGRTKLAMILFAKYGLAGKVIKENQDNIYAMSVHPGAVSYLFLAMFWLNCPISKVNGTDIYISGQHCNATAMEKRLPRLNREAAHLGHACVRAGCQAGLVQRAVGSYRSQNRGAKHEWLLF
jgi:NAD(P)-dependent dehydrogenase (short-subunit alcohol dehydrogenase family)